MAIYQALLEKLILPLGDKLTHGSFIDELRKLRTVSSLSEAELQSLHEQKLKTLLSHVKTNVPYYASLVFDEKKDVYHQLKAFPIMDKALLRANTDKLISKELKKEELIKHASSGSSGIQSTVYWSDKEQSINRATQILWWEWAGYKIGNPILQTGINPKRTKIKKLKDFFFRTKYIQAFSHKPEEVEEALRWAENKDAFLAGYASSLSVFAEIAESAGIHVKMKGAVSWGDKLFSSFRNRIDTVFQTSVKETYASAEGLMIAAQKDLEYMYIMSPNVHIEIVDDNGVEVEDGVMGHVMVTNLNAFAMPLVRYRIGDLGIKLPKSAYPANPELKFPILQRVIGRDTDIVRTPSGKSLVVHSFTGIFEHVPEIKQFCVIQENLQGIRIQYIPNENCSPEVLSAIVSKLNEAINEEFQIDFEMVEEIQATPSGKPQIIISKLPKPSLAS